MKKLNIKYTPKSYQNLLTTGLIINKNKGVELGVMFSEDLYLDDKLTYC